jgi:hypothetical protein
MAGAAELAAPTVGFKATSGGGETADPAFVAQHGLYWLTANINSREHLASALAEDLKAA